MASSSAKRFYRSNNNRGLVGSTGDAKFWDIASATYPIDTTGVVTHLSEIPRGTNINSRNGKACRVTSVLIRGHVLGPTNGTRQQVAGYLVWDYQPNEAIALITDIFDTANARSFPNRENNERFRILKIFFDNFNTYGGGTAFSVDEYVRLPEDCNILMTSAGSTGAIGETIQGALYFVTMGTQPVATNASSFLGGFRLNFTDDTT